MLRLLTIRAAIATLKRVIAISRQLRPRTWACLAITQAVFAAFCFWGYRQQSYQPYVLPQEKLLSDSGVRLIAAVGNHSETATALRRIQKLYASRHPKHQKFTTSNRRTPRRQELSTAAGARRIVSYGYSPKKQAVATLELVRSFRGRGIKAGDGRVALVQGERYNAIRETLRQRTYLRATSSYSHLRAKNSAPPAVFRSGELAAQELAFANPFAATLYQPPIPLHVGATMLTEDTRFATRAVGVSSLWPDLIGDRWHRRLPQSQPVLVSQPSAPGSTSLLDMLQKLVLLFQTITLTIGSAFASAFGVVSYHRGKADLKLKQLQIREMQIKLENMEQESTRARREATHSSIILLN